MLPHFPHWRRQGVAACFILFAAMFVTSAAEAMAQDGDSAKETVKAIVFAKGSIDPKHNFYWSGWTITFGATPPYGTFPDRGIEIRGLRCGQPGAKHLGCHLLMVMTRVESKPHYCEILPDSARAEGPWPLLIACPSKIAWTHKPP